MAVAIISNVEQEVYTSQKIMPDTKTMLPDATQIIKKNNKILAEKRGSGTSASKKSTKNGNLPRSKSATTKKTSKTSVGKNSSSPTLISSKNKTQQPPFQNVIAEKSGTARKISKKSTPEIKVRHTQSDIIKERKSNDSLKNRSILVPQIKARHSQSDAVLTKRSVNEPLTKKPRVSFAKKSSTSVPMAAPKTSRSDSLTGRAVNKGQTFQSVKKVEDANKSTAINVQKKIKDARKSSTTSTYKKIIKENAEMIKARNDAEVAALAKEVPIHDNKPVSGSQPVDLSAIDNNALKDNQQQTLLTLAPNSEADLDAKTAILKEIVEQAELHREIFCIFDNHRYVAEPVRSALKMRGWVEYQPDRASIPRRARTATQITHRQEQAIVNHTIASIQKQLTFGECKFHVTLPTSTPELSRDNQHILEYGRRRQPQPEVVCELGEAETPVPLSDADSKLVSRIIQENNSKISLLWLSSKPDVQLGYFSYVPEIGNKFQKTTFCSKFGLWYNLRNGVGHPKEVVFPVQTPRMFNLGDVENEAEFYVDFHMTAVFSVLKWFVTRVMVDGEEAVQHANGMVPMRRLEFCLKKGNLYIQHLKYKEAITQEDIMADEYTWGKAILTFYKIINEEDKLKPTPNSQIQSIYSRAKQILLQLRRIRPEMDYDGITNLWIVKPYSAACGRGIFISNSISYIQQLAQKKYIIQKYIERPFLISHTKFDIRQWFILTSLRPLEFWIYKESYLRFCTMPYDIRNFHESVHLSNNAIQKKYAKLFALPHQNMWHSSTFINYLTDLGKGDLWERRIFPGMRDAITCAMISSQDTFDKADPPQPKRIGWFELYGADFMLTANLADGPYLIEINETPALDPSTPVTARMCKQMLSDIFKVVIDRKKNPRASTGSWELGYRQRNPSSSKS